MLEVFGLRVESPGGLVFGSCLGCLAPMQKEAAAKQASEPALAVGIAVVTFAFCGEAKGE